MFDSARLETQYSFCSHRHLRVVVFGRFSLCFSAEVSAADSGKSCLVGTSLCKAGPTVHSIFISSLLAGRWLWLSAGTPVISGARLRLELQLHLLQYQSGRQQWKSPTDYTRGWGHGHCCGNRWESKQINWVSDNQVMEIAEDNFVLETHTFLSSLQLSVAA